MTKTRDEAAFGAEARVRSGFWRKLAKTASYIPFAEDAVAAYYCAFDQETPFRVRATLLGALAYFLLPTDSVPDLLPMLGFADDASVLAAAISTVGAHIGERHRAAARRVLGRSGGPAKPSAGDAHPA